MRVDQAFARAGFEIVNATKNGDQLVFDVRVPVRDNIPSRWTNLLAQVLPHAESVAGKAKPKWLLEVVKRFYSKNGVVRYLWRVTMSGNLAAGQAVLVQSTLDALRTGHELDEVPIPGQMNMQPDPAHGRFRGSYANKDGSGAAASMAVASAFTAGGV